MKDSNIIRRISIGELNNDIEELSKSSSISGNAS